ncbi:MAG TPA: PIN domain-containing protein [Longimicrobium sp.]|nr:PIN domain-containing protein [Longimicrobium sp.]
MAAPRDAWPPTYGYDRVLRHRQRPGFRGRCGCRCLLRILDVVPAERADLSHALSLGWRDFEDAVQTVSASKAGADCIVTRDLKDFRASPVPARDPAFILPLLG